MGGLSQGESVPQENPSEQVFRARTVEAQENSWLLESFLDALMEGQTCCSVDLSVCFYASTVLS